MSKTKNANPPRKLQLGEKIKLRDISWCLLFREYWAIYRRNASRVNIATFKVVDVLDAENITLECMDIVPEDGRLLIPVGMRANFQTKDVLDVMTLSAKMVK